MCAKTTPSATKCYFKIILEADKTPIWAETTPTQVQIADADNMAQYWPNLGSNSRVLLLGKCRRLHRPSAGPTTAAFFDCLNLPTFSGNLAQYRPYAKPIVTFTIASSSENRRPRVRPMDGTLLRHMSLLSRQTILEVRKPEFGTALAGCCAENKCSRPEFGPELAAKCIPELSLQQRHAVGNRSSATVLPMLDQFWALYNFTLGECHGILF